MNTISKALLLSSGFFLATISIAHSTEQESLVIEDDASWQYSLSPYLWFAGLKGDMATVPGLPSVPIDISPKELVDDSHISLTALFEAKYKHQGILIDYMYSDIRSEDDLDPNIDFVIGSKSKTTVISTAYLHEIYSDQNSVIDLFAGVRYWKMDNTLDISGDDSGNYNGVDINHSESWFDPFVGVKARTLINNSDFYIAASVAVGGFGVGSDMFYDASINIGYKWNNSIGTSLGYRVYDLDYDNKDFMYDAKQQGVVLGLTWDF